MGIISPFRPAASSGTDSQGSGETLNRSVASPEPHPFRKGSITASLLDGDDGGVPAPLSPEQVEAYLHDKARRTELAGYLADEMCALLDNEIIRPMTSNRRATFLALMEQQANNLAMAYRLPDDRRDEDDHTDSEFIEGLVDAARCYGGESQPFDGSKYVRMVFTFGYGQEFFPGYVVVYGDSPAHCRDLMNEHYGGKWSMAYPDEEHAGVEQYDLPLRKVIRPDEVAR